MTCTLNKLHHLNRERELTVRTSTRESYERSGESIRRALLSPSLQFSSLTTLTYCACEWERIVSGWNDPRWGEWWTNRFQSLTISPRNKGVPYVSGVHFTLLLEMKEQMLRPMVRHGTVPICSAPWTLLLPLLPMVHLNSEGTTSRTIRTLGREEREVEKMNVKWSEQSLLNQMTWERAYVMDSSLTYPFICSFTCSLFPTFTVH